MPIGKLSLAAISNTANQLSRRLGSLASQFQDIPPSYTIAGGFLIVDSIIGATSVDINTFPVWARNTKIYILIDVGTVEAEVRKVTNITGTVATFSEALIYTHAARDPVMFLTEVDLSPFWFGAVGDGVTDDHDAFQAAIYQMTDYSEGGGILRIPSETFFIGSTLGVPVGTGLSGSIIGAGMRRSTLLFDTGGAGAQCLNLDGVTDFMLSDFGIVGTEVGSTLTRGIRSVSCTGLRIKRVAVYYASIAGIGLYGGTEDAGVFECDIVGSSSESGKGVEMSLAVKSKIQTCHIQTCNILEDP